MDRGIDYRFGIATSRLTLRRHFAIFLDFAPEFRHSAALERCGAVMASNTPILMVCAVAMIFAHAAGAAPLTEKQKVEVLAAQNKYRAELGEPALVWSDKLAQNAQTWAEHLANEVHAMVHSGAIDAGENIATWPAGHASLTRLVRIWGAEKRYFINASFPDVSSTGSWQTVSHYSQLVWRKTTGVGCGFATGGGQDYLVCQYNPMGNFRGEKPF